ncbi:TetR/AcrR family transcriptional regulator [Vibrio sonorensis]|uniref:TetR/AcrR family transcriptional regulator n=1 Tax=Vibrio sonorensis TaxID=1004316 RepID=UPI0008DB2F3F|nr:TetR/AcrR family transcriptional regulator [Vibrio sonorensis]
MSEVRSVGRPSKSTHAREKLIQSAKELFVVMPYDKVSTRLIAKKAGVNSALIRYYFANKEGLFETMIRETLAPMQVVMNQLVKENTHKNLTDLMRTYYREMIKVPQFPRLISQVMYMSPSDIQRKLMEKVFLDVSKPMQELIFDRLEAGGLLQPGVDPNLCRISFISLMVFPFMAPPALLSIHGIELSEPFLERLFDHNIKLMTSGILNPQPQGEVTS